MVANKIMFDEQQALDQNSTLTPSPIDQLPTVQNPLGAGNQLSTNSRSKSFLLIIVGLFVAVFCIFLFFAYQYYEKIKIIDNSQSENQYPTITPITTPLSEPPETTSNPGFTTDPLPTQVVENNLTKPPEWKTYSSAQVGYSFRYPSYVELTEENVVQLSFWGPTQNANTEFYDGISLNFSLPFKIEGLALEEYVDQQIVMFQENGEIAIPRTKISYNNYQGYYFVVQGMGTFKNIYLQSPSKEWVVEIVDSTVDPTNQGYLETVKQILNSFQFEK
ncbi:MAG TPA: hypothetical protein PKX78_00345 [Candidatus Woesebacteria bacterium]|nr:hypothetical protein [Candidatus Woesebacteria bacterium]